MSSVNGTNTRGFSATRTFLIVAGAVAAIIGLLILIWPGHTAIVVTAILASYAIVDGLVYAALGFFVKEMGGWSRIGHVILGVLFIIAGIIAFSRLATTTAGLFVFVGILIGIVWVIEGIASLVSLGSARSKTMTVIFAILSIIAGIVLLLSPLYSIVLWTFLGISLLVLGIAQIFRGISWRHATL
ncbi:MAG TPA: DUF308 domain-containing protein [Gryllotalpicola sp.]